MNLFQGDGAMILDGRIDLDVPAEKAWDFLIDINKFSTYLPGIDEVTVNDSPISGFRLKD